MLRLPFVPSLEFAVISVANRYGGSLAISVRLWGIKEIVMAETKRRRLGKCEIIEEIGCGGLVVVYEAPGAGCRSPHPRR